ncbi:STAS domain-containing protein [Niallia sp. Krafla_26]|uniref:STAS domain-containing protein n=1 Tax=Niallia sp. Krafla_26 TaxID=3064703 RepID=UPI003D168E67
MDLLSVQTNVQNSTMVIKLKGTLDISTSNVIDPYLAEMGEIDVLIIDFSDLEFIDSTGIGSIMNAIYLSKDKGFKLTFEGVDELTHQVFETVGLFQIMEALREDEQ